MSGLPKPNPYDLLPEVPAFRLASNTFDDGRPLDHTHTAAGGHVSPSLEWADVPDGTQSFVVSCFDPDAPTPSGFWHWVVVDLPAEVRKLDAGISDESLPTPAFHVRNDAGSHGYYGAEPPEGDPPHRYIYVVHAVDRPTLGVNAADSPALVAFELAYATLGRATLIGTCSVANPESHS